MMQDEFSRTRLLLGREAVDRLAQCRVIIFGVGGVGSYAAEALARSGVGVLELVDSDKVALSNLNRQLIALHSTIGQYKVEAAAARIRDINPRCQVTVRPVFYLPETQDQFNFSQYDYIVDAVDTVKAKLALIENAQAAGTPIISSMGAGNKLDPTAFRVADIYDTSVCPLARVMRTECRKRGIRHLKVVYSQEPPLVPQTDPDDPEPLAASRRSTPGSVAFVPSVVGLMIAGEVVKDLINK